MANSVFDVLTSVATVGAVVVAAWQVTLTRRELMRRDRHEFEGVNLSGKVQERPETGGPTGLQQWVFEFVVSNPSSLPIDNVSAVAHLGAPASRLLHTGRSEDPTDSFSFEAAVIPGGGTQSWRRRVLVELSDHSKVAAITGTVTFRDSEGKTRVNPWPRLSRDGQTTKR
mgnify:CR=1 FL=1